MPSPFPGMDPYLEDPQEFPSFHHSFVTYLQAALQPSLPEAYFAKANERIWIEMSHRYIEPGLSVLRKDRLRDESDGNGGVAVANVATPVVVTVEATPNDERHEAYLEVFHNRAGERRLVTSIEVLSPSNKTPGEHGYDLYFRKQRELLAGQANLVEIDLLRRGVHTTAVPHGMAAKLAGQFDYHVSVYRFYESNRYYVYPIHLPDRLPIISIPLLPGDGNVPLDLQAVFNMTYETGPYRRELDYERTEPEPALSPEQLLWAKKIVSRQKV